MLVVDFAVVKLSPFWGEKSSKFESSVDLLQLGGNSEKF